MEFQGQFESFHRFGVEDRVKNGEGAATGNAEEDEIQRGAFHAQVPRLAVGIVLLAGVHEEVE